MLALKKKYLREEGPKRLSSHPSRSSIQLAQPYLSSWYSFYGQCLSLKTAIIDALHTPFIYIPYTLNWN